jgi:hypothetical protein
MPAPPSPQKTVHGKLGCFRFRGAVPVFKLLDQLAQHQVIWRLLGWACARGFASPTEVGGMRLAFDREPSRER